MEKASNGDSGKFNLGKATKRGIKHCPSCGTINGTRGSKCKNKKCNLILREMRLAKPSAPPVDAVKLITDTPLELYSINTGTSKSVQVDLCAIVELPVLQDGDGVLINNASIQDNPASNEAFNKLISDNAKCYFDGCISMDNSKACEHVAAAMACKKEARPLQLKSSCLSALAINNELKTDIMQLACNTPGPLMQRLSKELFVVKCINEERFPFGFLHLCFNENRNDKTLSKFACSCSTFKMNKMRLLELSDPTKALPSTPVSRYCTHYYSALATFLSDDELSKEFHFLINKEGSAGKVVKSANNSLVVNSGAYSTQAAPTTNHFVNIQKKQPSLLIISKGALQSQNMLTNAVSESEQAATNATESKTSWLFTDWLAGLTEQINEAMHYQMGGEANRLVFRIPQHFFQCLQQRIASSAVVTGGAVAQLNKKIRMPNSVTEFERKESPPFGVFTKFTWNIYNVLHVKSIFDTQLKLLDLQRSFIQKADNTYELYASEKTVKSANEVPLRPHLYKTYLKIGKMRIDGDQEQSTPFTIEWTPNLYPKSQIGELVIKFEFGHLK